MNKIDFSKYNGLTFDDFCKLAQDKSISKYEKIGFPDEYRKGYESKIFADILTKLPALNETDKVIVDIGCGCSDLNKMMIDKCRQNNHKLILIDSIQMLSLIKDEDFIIKIPGKFPQMIEQMQEYLNSADGILVYSVAQTAMLDANLFDFFDKAVMLLKSEGKMLIGDIPNESKRNRFFVSERGIKYHQNFTETDEVIKVNPYKIAFERFDDGMVFAILQRYRNFGFETYLLPQANDIHFSNRREDIIIVRN